MTENLIESILDFIRSYQYIGAFIVVLLEYACFPLPSELILPFVGFIAAQSNKLLPTIIFICTMASLLGSTICYLIGYYGGDAIINWIKRKFPSSIKSFYTLEKFFNKYGNKTLVFARMVPLTRTYISLFAGSLRYNFTKFIMYSSIGILFWNTILVLLGYYLGEHLETISNIFNNFGKVCAIILSTILLIYLFKKFIKLRKLG
ncbi:membrane protein DedA, SNARE-associated domain [Clostridium cavendishii DSM 21758]|uniref:Membrane protein DedA, SNARE-associated domain n=1 Tax=Clostridium cavendishii DSM 21758 TaxID=1121302 RepID=A0A1M6NKL1_9CLOT|nr:DedA family protein [Clostridium cavendishii]SHJ96240.1 membrane protein DedA, SNARE-associated domain [Clostridium cavendishii DSM 21758]